MFRKTSRQEPLFGIEVHFPKSVVKRLRGSWAEQFHRKIYPILLDAEERFAILYCPDNGAPNWSVARMLGILLLQQWFDLSDQEALDELSFDIRWQYALRVAPEEAYLNRRSLVGFRSRLVNVDPDGGIIRQVFDEIALSAISELGLSVQEQRLDSTIVCSNIQTHGRYDLFCKTLNVMLRFLEQTWPDRLALLSEGLRAWYGREKSGSFGNFKEWPAERYRLGLQQAAEWLAEIAERFKDDKPIEASEPYLLVVRLVSHHTDYGDTDPPDDNKPNDSSNDSELGRPESTDVTAVPQSK